MVHPFLSAAQRIDGRKASTGRIERSKGRPLPKGGGEIAKRSGEREAGAMLGQFLKEASKNEGGRPTETSASAEEVRIPTLSDLGPTKKWRQ